MKAREDASVPILPVPISAAAGMGGGENGDSKPLQARCKKAAALPFPGTKLLAVSQQPSRGHREPLRVPGSGGGGVL
eukprot:CAMPEP_0204605474 /NCGR_PEP_ID=MMETSP0661-20131031/58503_1 /ASSEMBLY_ACC=CAM_ASM_000606 /TAXON_ID=109239 /ORGANISM="Alexandrium margalefi, Strain AMGDE01CS-322" /LENGTH=76 /DNA_ID=CAMNT_0051616715 /DNA_START=20 /DNA_END=251 /DNA_ORIENTATION=-